MNFSSVPVWRPTRQREQQSIPTGDRGNVIIGFVGALTLLLALVYLIMSAALAIYAQTIAQDAAMEGARVAALDGGSPSAGSARTRELLSSSLAQGSRADIVVSVGVEVARIDVSVPLQLPWVLGTSVGASASVAIE